MLFNKETFYPDIEVKSLYFHDTRRELPDKVMEGDQGWVLQGVLSRASFRRQPLSGQKTFTVLSLHVSNIYAKKRCIAKKLILTIRAVMLGGRVDLVAGDFKKNEKALKMVTGTFWNPWPGEVVVRPRYTMRAFVERHGPIEDCSGCF